MAAADHHAVASLFDRESVTILITDSGLGGLSIFADIAARLRREPIFPRVSLVYYNAWPEQNRGYNSLKSMDERIRVFDRALSGMKRYRPDIIMIACNTLSVLFDRTAFSRNESIPVVDIVRFGVDGLHDAFSGRPEAMAVLLGTVTTIASGVHRSQLIQKGISPERIVDQPCDQLATQIEKGPQSDTVRQMIDGFMEQAAARIPAPPSQLYAALYCTHFGYCAEPIRTSLENRAGCPVAIVDPNRHMAEFLFNSAGGVRHDRASVDLSVVSRITWDSVKIDAISKAIEKRSAETAEALGHYEHLPELFTF